MNFCRGCECGGVVERSSQLPAAVYEWSAPVCTLVVLPHPSTAALLRVRGSSPRDHIDLIEYDAAGANDEN
jgi:hypothetical protein